jgi:hypothetical protein
VTLLARAFLAGTFAVIAAFAARLLARAEKTTAVALLASTFLARTLAAVAAFAARLLAGT